MIHRRRVPVSPLPVRVFLYESDNAPTDCDLHLHGLQNVRVIFYFLDRRQIARVRMLTYAATA